MPSFQLLHLAALLAVSSAFVIRKTNDYEAYSLDEGKPRPGIPEINTAPDRRFFEGDIIVPLERNALRNSSYRWKLPVPYIMGNSLDLNTRGVILQAFEMFRLKSCIDFKPYEGEKSYLQFEKLDGLVNGRNAVDVIYLDFSQAFDKFPYDTLISKLTTYGIDGNTINWIHNRLETMHKELSSVAVLLIGRNSQVQCLRTGQNVSIGMRCEYKDTVEHEVLHALGFYHEQSRSDRDDYVNIWWDEIIEGQEHNFNKYDDSFISDLNTPYDYESVMHYGPYSFNINSSIPSITTKIPEFNDVIGQSQDLSRVDLQRLNRMYNCASSLTLLDQCSFESINICGMIQNKNDNADWQHTVMGHCAEMGYFMRLDTTAGNSGESAILESRILYPRRNEKCLQFFYKFDGSVQDELIIWIKSDDGTGNVRKTSKLQAISADGEQNWNLATIPFKSQTKFRYVFHGIKGNTSSSTGGINIDEVSLTETQCPTGIWQIRNITSLLNSTSKGDYISSPLFYSSEGYCFVLRLFPHGPANSTSRSYLGIMFALCSSQNDGGLEWPAGNRQVTFTIVDQNHDITQRMSASRSFTTNPEQLHNGSYFWDKPSITGSFDTFYNRFIGPTWGWNYILPHSELHRKNFLKNDNLIIFASFEVVEDPGSVL